MWHKVTIVKQYTPPPSPSEQGYKYTFIKHIPGSCSADFGETGKIKGFEHVRSNAIMPKQYLFLTSISFILIKYYQKWFNDCNMIMHFKSETAEWMNYYSLIGQFDCNRIYKVNKFNII